MAGAPSRKRFKPDPEKGCPFPNLPVELILQIAGYLPNAADLVSLAVCSRRFFQVLKPKKKRGKRGAARVADMDWSERTEFLLRYEGDGYIWHKWQIYPEECILRPVEYGSIADSDIEESESEDSDMQIAATQSCDMKIGTTDSDMEIDATDGETSDEQSDADAETSDEESDADAETSDADEQSDADEDAE